MKITSKNIKKFLKKLPWFLGEHAFLTILTLIFLAVIISGSVFYKYVILAEKADPLIVEKAIRFDSGQHREILDEWDRRRQAFKAVGDKEYFDLFNIPTATSVVSDAMIDD